MKKLSISYTIIPILFCAVTGCKVNSLKIRSDISNESKYQALVDSQLQGWNTYNTRSTLSFVNMPSCFSINIGFKDYTNKEILTESIPGFDHEDFDKERSILKLWDVSLNGLYVMDCKALADIAEILGKNDDATKLRSRADIYASNLNDRLWDAEAGFFKNKNWETGSFPDFTAINGFLALLTGKLEEKQVDRLIQDHLMNKDEFKTTFIIPTVPKSNPVFKEDRYWDGRVWPPVNFLVYLGLNQYEYPAAREAKNFLVKNSRELLLQDWQRYHYVRENYDPFTGTGTEKNQSARFYHWGGLLGMMSLIEEGVIPVPD